jgi:predicted transcriptional regulator of viral defense system
MANDDDSSSYRMIDCAFGRVLGGYSSMCPICEYFTVRSHVCKLWKTHRLMTRADFSGLWDQLLSEGMNTVTIDEVESRTGVTRNAVYLGVKYAIDRKRLFSPARGLYVVVPPEYRTIGVVPATHFIDPMMNHLGIEYYVGLGTAAGWWGSSHHAAQEFQVIVNGRLPDRTIGNVRLRFISRARLDDKAIRRVAGPRTMLNVSTPDLTAVDLAANPTHVGGLSNVATILADLPGLDGPRIGALAKHRSRADARRLGWLLSLVRDDVKLRALMKLADPTHGQPTLLASKGRRNGRVDDDWNVLVNTNVEPDL